MSIGKRLNRSSWVRNCFVETIHKNSGRDLLNPVGVRYYSTFNPVDLQDKDGDIDYIVKSSDRLDLLAQKFYGASALWWVIAQKNDLDLPIAEMQEGMELIIPDPKYVLTDLVGKKSR